MLSVPPLTLNISQKMALCRLSSPSKFEYGQPAKFGSHCFQDKRSVGFSQVEPTREAHEPSYHVFITQRRLIIFWD